MPIPPQPLNIHCPRCGWHTRWQPRSDALTTEDVPPSQCPRCGNEALDLRQVRGVGGLLGGVLGRLGTLFDKRH
jgi:endogenous inhibitor of DNA gyrase (YacG/DUF329 family)